MQIGVAADSVGMMAEAVWGVRVELGLWALSMAFHWALFRACAGFFCCARGKASACDNNSHRTLQND